MLQKGTIILLTLSCALLGWQVYHSQQQQAAIQKDLDVMKEHTLVLEKQVLTLEKEVLKLEGETIEGMVEDAQQGVLENWEELIDVFQDELGNLKDKIREDLENPPTNGKRT